MSEWVKFIKKFANENNLSYGCALSNPNCSKMYKEFKMNKQQKKPRQYIPIDDEYLKNKYRFRESKRELRHKMKKQQREENQNREEMGSEDIRESYKNKISNLLDELRRMKKKWVKEHFFIDKNGLPELIHDGNNNAEKQLTGIQYQIIKIARDNKDIPTHYLGKYPGVVSADETVYIPTVRTFVDLYRVVNSQEAYKNSRNIISYIDDYNEKVSQYLSKHKKLNKQQQGVLDKYKSRINDAQHDHDVFIDSMYKLMESVINSHRFGLELHQKYGGIPLNK